ncbi:MAG: hypothetical protein ACI85O_003059 [Saprospiraceae bacterium]|jgi:hypothetical protein
MKKDNHDLMFKIRYKKDCDELTRGQIVELVNDE